MSLAAPIRFSVVAGSLPPGLGLDSGGLLSGVPSTPGPFTFTIRATGSDGNYVQRAYTMGVGEITPDFLPDASSSAPYSQTLTANGFSSPTFSIIAGALPSPLTLHPATGVISGSAPTESGLFFFTVQATDGVLTCTKDLSINVAASNYQYWTLSELSGDRIDSIQSAHLVPFIQFTGTITRIAGKVTWGVELVSDGADEPSLDQVAGTGLPYVTGTGHTLCGWLQYDVISAQYLSIGFTNAAAQSRYFTISNDGFLDCSLVAVNPGFTNTVAPLVPAAQWVFFILELGPAGMAWEINRNGTITTHAVAQPANGSIVDVFIITQGVAGQKWMQSEIAHFPMLLTAAQKDYLFNSGSGRTLPITLP